MKLKLKTSYLVISIIVFILIIIGYIIRHRPIDNLNSFLLNNYPSVETNEAKQVCDRLKVESRKLLKYMIYKFPHDSVDTPDSSVLFEYARENNINIFITDRSEICKKYNIRNSADSLKVDEYLMNVMHWLIELKVKYLYGGSRENWKERNFLERYFFFDFEALIR
jgi:hypothetical protein